MPNYYGAKERETELLLATTAGQERGYHAAGLAAWRYRVRGNLWFGSISSQDCQHPDTAGEGGIFLRAVPDFASAKW